MDTLGFEPRAFRMRSGCDTTTPCALEVDTLVKASGFCTGAAMRLRVDRGQGGEAHTAGGKVTHVWAMQWRRGAVTAFVD